MRALVITEHGPPEVLRVQERPDPVPGAGEVRVRVRAAGVNFADLLARVGLYPEGPKPPAVVGYEIAGEVESLGPGVEGLAVDQRVMGVAPAVSIPLAESVGAPQFAVQMRRVDVT